MIDPINNLRSRASNPQTSFLVGTVFAASYSKTALGTYPLSENPRPLDYNSNKLLPSLKLYWLEKTSLGYVIQPNLSYYQRVQNY